MPYFQASLRAALTRALPLQQGLRIAIGICDALAYGASIFTDFAHGDLKPENILVDAQEKPQVADFGLARAARYLSGTEGAVAAEPTGPRAGTPMYMAPEMIRRGETSLSSDIYALGCIIHEMLAGTPVFAQATSMSEVLRAHVGQKPASLRDIDRNIPRKLAKLVLQ
jgi:serine/threonine protein kinase